MTKANSLRLFSAWVLLSAACLAPAHGEEAAVKVGVLHSLSGSMAISETSLRDILLFAFDEINAKGGVLGRKIDPVVEDGASNWPLFAEKATQLLETNKVVATFGCWTSISRKSVLPVFERDNGLLFYSVQYEGEESSKNIFYAGETASQQAVPAVDYLLRQGRKKFYLLGTDYIYPQTTNLILFHYLLSKGVPLANLGGGYRKDGSGKFIAVGKYVPFGHLDLQPIVADLKQFAGSGDACVISTLNGDSNGAFFRESVAAGLTPDNCPVVSFSLAEDELRGMPAKDLVGELGCWSYFQSLKTPANAAFLASWQSWLTTQTHRGVARTMRTVDSPMVLSYDAVYLWKAAVEKAGSFAVDKVRAALESGVSFEGPGGKITIQANHQTTKNIFIGKTLGNGQFEVVESLGQIRGEPFLLKSLDEKLAATAK